MDETNKLTYKPPYTSIFVERGVFHCSMVRNNADGTKTVTSEGGWERDPKGGSVTLVPVDENDKQIGEAMLCGIYANPEYIVIRLLEMLGIPTDRDFAEKLLKAAADELGAKDALCVFCHEWDCGDCTKDRREMGAPWEEST